MLLAMANGCTASGRSPGGYPVHTVEAQALLDAAYRAMATQQLGALLEIYTEDAIIQSAGEPAVAGKQAIERFWSLTFARFDVALTACVEECVAAGEAVIVRGRATGGFAPKHGGPAVPVDSWFLQIYKRASDGRLRYWRGANGPMAPPT